MVGFCSSAMSITFFHSCRNIHHLRSFFFCPGESAEIPNGRDQMILVVLTIHVFKDMSQSGIRKAMSWNALFPIAVGVLFCPLFIMPRQSQHHAHREQVAPAFSFVHISDCARFELRSFARVKYCYRNQLPSFCIRIQLLQIRPLPLSCFQTSYSLPLPIRFASTFRHDSE